ncbi:MAG: hypothetical protein J7605_27575 [Variovorax sp.]|nr:hypothetical protein [Variovorax sp.]
MAQRFAGCFVAGAVAFALLPLLQEKPVWCQIALALGVWTGAYLRRGAPRLRYAALQFSGAFLMMFVQDRGWTVEPEPALVRLGVSSRASRRWPWCCSSRAPFAFLSHRS